MAAVPERLRSGGVVLAFSLSTWLTDLVTGHWWTYLILFAGCALDSLLFFIVPSETMTILAGVLASKGSLWIWLVIPVAAVGVFAGDNMMFFLGRWLGEPLSERIRRRARGRRWLDEGHGLIERHGEIVIVVGRFIPAGRTAATFSAGMLDFPWRRFAAADGVAAILWAVYAAMLGYLGGTAFQHSFWKPFLIALGIAFVVAGLGEGWRRLQQRRGRDVLGGKD